MSISNLFQPNSYNLFSRTLTTDSVDTTEYQVQGLGMYNGTNDEFLNSTITLKYNYTGVCTIFYDSATATTNAIANNNASDIKLGTATGQYDITGFPNMRGANGIEITHFATLKVDGDDENCLIKLTKVSDTEVNISFLKLDRTAFNIGETFGVVPFTFDYIVQN